MWILRSWKLTFLSPTSRFIFRPPFLDCLLFALRPSVSITFFRFSSESQHNILHPFTLSRLHCAHFSHASSPFKNPLPLQVPFIRGPPQTPIDPFCGAATMNTRQAMGVPKWHQSFLPFVSNVNRGACFLPPQGQSNRKYIFSKTKMSESRENSFRFG